MFKRLQVTKLLRVRVDIDMISIPDYMPVYNLYNV